MSKLKLYAKTIFVPVAIGALVGLIMSGSIDYEQLKQPAIAPPGWLFPVVWTVLYILMGISFGRLVEKSLDTPNVKKIYYAQLFVNALWSIIFFVLKWRLFAFFWILLLLILVITLIVTFYNKDKISGLLQIPYLLWTTFATYLNLAVYFLNK